MNNAEKNDAKKIALLINCGRTNKKLSQTELASLLGISQGQISKLEKGVAIPSATLWMNMCRLLDIYTDSLRSGYIDKLSFTTVRSTEEEGGFYLPARYRQDRGIKIRDILPLLIYCKDTVGEKSFKDLIKQLKIPQSFFINLDHQINLNLTLDILQIIFKTSFATEQHINNFLNFTSRPSSHGALDSIYQQAEDQIDLMKKFVTNSDKYQCYFKYSIEDMRSTGMNISIQPSQIFKNFMYDQKVYDYLTSYFKIHLEKILSYEMSSLTFIKNKKDFKVTTLQPLTIGNDLCIYKLTAA
jgi:transcriptional regulator with XRE-family HTH domain